jgi:nucleoside-diphosphate-sugar epimerase
MQSAYDGERIALEAGQKHGFGVSVLRCGWFYGADSGHTQMFRDGLRKRQIPIIGRGDALWACLHLDDAAAAFVAAIEQAKTGVWHVVDDQPVTVRDFMWEFTHQLDAKPPRSLPTWLARLLAGKQAVEFFTQSTWTLNHRFRRDLSWAPQYGTYREGIVQIVAQWALDS